MRLDLMNTRRTEPLNCRVTSYRAHGAGQAGVSKTSSLTRGGCPVLIWLANVQ